jgi:hypothetical protein
MLDELSHTQSDPSRQLVRLRPKRRRVAQGYRWRSARSLLRSTLRIMRNECSAWAVPDTAYVDGLTKAIYEDIGELDAPSVLILEAAFYQLLAASLDRG